MADPKEKKRGPEWNVRIPTDKPNRLRRETAFLCNIRFKNDLPEIPCDPKLLLPPYSKEEIAAFKLTEMEKDLRKDLLFEPDLGIPIHPWNIERYSVPEQVPPLHPDDAALVESDEELEPKRARLRGEAAELSWLMRTKYMTAEANLRRGVGGAKAAVAAAAADADAENEDPREARLRQIEAQFAAAQAPPVHGKDPSLVPVEVLPVFPDDLMEGRSCVLATYDNNPLDDVDALEGLGPELRARAAQAHQLKSFRAPNGQQFVTLLVPTVVPPPGDDELSARGGVPAQQLVRDYRWQREYFGAARLDDKGSTYLFRFSDDGTVRFHDLNTRLDMRKRKRSPEEEEEAALVPEKVLLRLPGHEDEPGEDEEQEGRQRSGAQRQQNGGRVDWGEEEEEEGRGGGDGGGDAEEEAAAGGGSGDEAPQTNAALRDVFGSDDDDI